MHPPPRAPQSPAMPRRSSPIRVRYTPRQRAAVVRAQLELKLGPKRTTELLNAGALEDQQGRIAAPDPGMPATTAADLARRERRKRERLEASPILTESPLAARSALCGRAVALVERELEKLERKRGNVKPSELVALLRLSREADALLRAQPGGDPKPSSAAPPAPPSEGLETTPEEERPPSLEEEIATEEARRRRSRRPTSTPPPVMQIHDASAQEEAIQTMEDIFKYIAETYLEEQTPPTPTASPDQLQIRS